jgi:signal transduction histidine kinase
MFYSLRFSILLSMFAVAAVVILTVTVVAGAGTRAEFSRYVETGRELREERLQQVVVWWAENNQNPLVDDLNALQYLTNSTGETTVEGAGFRFHPLGTIEMLESASRTAATDPGQVIRFEAAPDGEVVIYQGQEKVGNYYTDPVTELELLLAQVDFMETVNWTLLISAILAAGVAVTLTVILSRRVLHPVAALTQAARRMESGDLSQRVQVHSGGEIGELAQAFNAMAEAINRNEKLRRNMVTDIAHELRTPLTNIRGYLEALHDGMLQPDAETIDLLYDEAMLLNRLIQDLQELAMAEAGQLHLEQQPLQVGDVIEQAATMHRPTASSKDITLKTSLPDNLPAVHADQRRVAQILRNLVRNAIQHTPPGGIVHLSADVQPKMVEVHVEDTGHGISSEHLPYLFERFYRADPSRSRATGGAGLGLAIVKQLVEAHGGSIRAESTRGEGTTFSFTLPRIDHMNPAHAAPQSQSQSQSMNV